MKSNQEDLYIIDQVLSGEKSLYTSLVNKYKDYAYTVAIRVLNHSDEAEEATQDAFIKAYNNLSKFNRTSKFSTWLYRIVFNTAITYSRKRNPDTYAIETVGNLPSQRETDALEQEDKKKFIAQALKELLPVDATLITLFYMKEHSLEEISEITGLKSNAVKVKLFRARKRLANELDRILNKEAHTL